MGFNRLLRASVVCAALGLVPAWAQAQNCATPLRSECVFEEALTFAADQEVGLSLLGAALARSGAIEPSLTVIEKIDPDELFPRLGTNVALAEAVNAIRSGGNTDLFDRVLAISQWKGREKGLAQAKFLVDNNRISEARGILESLPPAEGMAARIGDAEPRIWVDVAIGEARSGNIEAAVKTCNEIDSEKRSNWCRAKLGKVFAATGESAAARAMIESQTSAYYRVRTQVLVAEGLALDGQRDRSRQLFSEALEEAPSLKRISRMHATRAQVYRAIANGAEAVGFRDQSRDAAESFLKIAEGIAWDGIRNGYMSSAARVFAGLGEISKAGAILERMNQAHQRREARTEIIVAMVEAGRDEDAEQIARNGVVSEEAALPLAVLGRAYAGRPGGRSKSRGVIAEAYNQLPHAEPDAAIDAYGNMIGALIEG